jgi:hypothetical protein
MKNRDKLKKGYHLIACPGAAHSNAFIDNCGLCAPRWGFIEVLEGCNSLEEHRDKIHAMDMRFGRRLKALT